MNKLIRLAGQLSALKETLNIIDNKNFSVPLTSEKFGLFSPLELSVLKEAIFDLHHEYKNKSRTSLPDETSEQRKFCLGALLADIDIYLESD